MSEVIYLLLEDIGLVEFDFEEVVLCLKFGVLEIDGVEHLFEFYVLLFELGSST
jgi:hypothetical protein